MAYSGCNELISLAAACASVKKAGGVCSRVWIGERSDLEAKFRFVLSSGVVSLSTDGTEIEQKLYKFEGLPANNDARYELVPGENRNLFKHIVSLVLFHSTQEEQKAIEALMSADNLFVIIETEAGKLRVYGIDYNPVTESFNSDQRRGLTPASGAQSEGVLVNDRTGATIAMEGTLYQTPFYLETISDTEDGDVTDVDDMIEILDAWSVAA